MSELYHGKVRSAIFITFSGNCKKALTFYQGCFGGSLQLETFKKELIFYARDLVVSGSLVSDSLTIHGSDLVHDEGRRPGNHISIYLCCKSSRDRKALIQKLGSGRAMNNYDDQKLVEVTDAFDVRWVLGV